MKEEQAAMRAEAAKWAVRRVAIVAALVPVVWWGVVLNWPSEAGLAANAVLVVLGTAVTSAIFWGLAAGWFVDTGEQGRWKLALGTGAASVFVAPLLAAVFTAPLGLLVYVLPDVAVIPAYAFGAVLFPLFAPLATIPVGIAMGAVAWLMLRGHHRKPTNPAPVAA